MPANEIELFAATFPGYLNDQGGPFDQVYPKAELTGYLMAKDKQDEMNGNEDRLKRVRTQKGGRAAEVILEHADEKSNRQYFTGITPINFTKKETITNAQYEWANLAHTLLIDKKDILDISGQPAKINDFARVKKQGMWKSLKSQLNEDLLGLTAVTDGFSTMPLLIPKDPSLAVNVGGRDPNANSEWRTKTKTSTTDATTTFTQLRREIRNLVNNCADNSEKSYPDVAFTDQIVYEYFQAYLEEKGQHAFNNKEMANVMKRPKILNVEGLDILWDNNVPNMFGSGSYSSFFVMNSDYMYFLIQEGRNMTVSKGIDMMETKGQDALGFFVLLRGQLCQSVRRVHGLLHKINQNIVTL